MPRRVCAAIRASLVSAVEGKLKRRFEADFTTKEAKMRDMVADEQTIQLGAAQLKQFIQGQINIAISLPNTSHYEPNRSKWLSARLV